MLVAMVWNVSREADVELHVDVLSFDLDCG